MRNGVNVLIDNQPQALPPSGKIEYPLTAGEHKVTMDRDGGQAELSRSFQLGERFRFTPLFRRKLDAAIVDIRDEHGISYVSVELNGKKSVEMVVDTGAASVSLSWETAVEVGLNPAAGEEIRVAVADGKTYLARKVTIPTVRVGGALARNVECVVNPPEYPNVPLLLGKSFLKHFKQEIDEVKGELVFSKALDSDAELSH
jgi:clan AA aspartic protease (TIGR02281 family)